MHLLLACLGGTREHPWDKALDSWHGCGKLESLSEVLVFPVLSILQLGFQLVSLSLGTISHVSSLPQSSASLSEALLEMCPACIPSETAWSDSSTSLHCSLHKGTSNPAWRAARTSGWKYPSVHGSSGTGARVVTVSSPSSSSPPPVAVGGAVQLPGARVLLRFPPISKKHAVCHGAVLKPLVPHLLNGQQSDR